MIKFLILAVALTAAAVGAVIVPLVRRSERLPAPAPWAAISAAGALVLGAAVLYAMLSNYSWNSSLASDSSPDTPARMVGRLASRLEGHPNDLNGWLMLGRSYFVLENSRLAIHAYEQADRLANGQSVEALLGLGEALTLDNEAELNGRAGQLFERALQLEPKSEKALFYGGAAAARRGDLALARERFASLLALNPPDNIKSILQNQIAALDVQPGGAPTSAPAVAEPASAAGAAAVRVKVAFDSKLGKAPAAPLFVLVRDPSNPGPPLAVKRLESKFPQTVELTSSDSMIAGRSFAPGQQVEVVARIALSGNPVGARGDPVGRASYHVGRDGLVNLIIDRLTP